MGVCIYKYSVCLCLYSAFNIRGEDEMSDISVMTEARTGPDMMGQILRWHTCLHRRSTRSKKAVITPGC